MPNQEQISLEQATVQDIQTGIRYIKGIESKIIASENEFREIFGILDDELIPSGKASNVLERRAALKKVNTALNHIGAVLGVFTATRRELDGELKEAQAGLFDNKEPNVDPITGEVIDEVLDRVADEMGKTLKPGESITVSHPGKPDKTVIAKPKKPSNSEVKVADAEE